MSLECTVTFNESWTKTMNQNPELHWSALKHMGRSAAHYRSNLLEPREASAQMNFGTLVHCLVLGGPFTIYDQTKTRAGKAWDAFEAAHPDEFIVTVSEHERAKRVAESVLLHPLAAPLLLGKKEEPWKVKMFGRECAGRIDVLGAGRIVDLKTCSTSEPGTFSRACLRMGYHAQLAWYQEAVRKSCGLTDGFECFIVGVETSAPYAVTVLRVTERALNEGAKLNRLWLEKLAACELADEWPAYTQSILDLDVVEDADIEIDGEDVGEMAVQ